MRSHQPWAVQFIFFAPFAVYSFSKPLTAEVAENEE
jgi:hypothetical protein